MKPPGLLLLIATTACARSHRGARVEFGDLLITHAVAWGLPEDSAGTVGFWLQNRGSRGDTLTRVHSMMANVTMHDVQASGGFRRMIELSSVALPPGARVVFGTGRQHLMLAKVDPLVWSRDSVPLELSFARAGIVRLSVPVLRVTEAQEELEKR